MTNILFVCTGNTCRSPMAAAIAKHHDKGVNVKSAGIFAEDGYEASPNTVEALREQGIAIEHSSQALTPDLVEWATYILTMTTSHKTHTLQRFPEASHKVFTLSEFAQEGLSDIVDPYGGSLELYRRTYKELDKSVQLVLGKLK